MICKKCRADNAPIKKCCARCGSFLVGMTINNVTGEYGYRGDDGLFYDSEEEYNTKKNEPKPKRDSRPKCLQCNSLMECANIVFLDGLEGVGLRITYECKQCNKQLN